MEESPTERRLKQMVRMAGGDVSRLNYRDGFLTPLTVPGDADDKPYPLTKEEALRFVKTDLGIRNPESDIKSNPLELLNNVIDRINKVIPFTNIHICTTEIICKFNGHRQARDMLSLEGGTCYWINPFTKALLQHLGFKVYHICGNNPGDDTKDTHISTIACDVTYPGSRHLVDPGTRRPLCAAISLDFDKESPVYKFNYMRSKFFKDGNKLVWCAQTLYKVPDTSVMFDSEGQKWNVQVTYFLHETRQWYSYLSTCEELWKMANVKLANMKPPFNGLVFFAYLNDARIVSILAYGDKIVTYFLEEDSYQRVLMSKDELMKLFQNHFPQYSKSKLQEAFKVIPLV